MVGQDSMTEIIQGRILVVDDEVSLAEALKELIQFYGYEVDIAYNGSQAKETLSKQQFDLVISDIRMPVMDGIQLLSFIQQNHVETPVILISGFSDCNERMAIEKGACCLVSKPVDIENLISLIKQHSRTPS
jgi:two-component system response regulator HydG